MKTERYVSVMANLKKENRLNTALITVLVFLVVVLAIYSIALSKRQTTVIIPKGLAASVEVGQSEADQEYLSAMGNYVAYMFLNFDPQNVIGQYEVLATLATTVARKQMFETATEYKRNNISSRIYIRKINVTDQVIEVYGERSKYILDKEVENKTFVLKVAYEISFGSFRVKELIL
jgi:type IV conjugative transfer system protein TraE